ncbi:MAG TPA: hypothetical protein PLJ38_04205 [bacterium]|nr:hypothetical protein [bacterium]
MKEFYLKAYDASPELFFKLEELGLIKLFKPTLNTLNLPLNKNAVEWLYTTDEQYGTHKLICVGINSTTIRLNYHPDNEDFILVNNSQYKFKNLYLIIGLEKQEILQQKINEETLADDDVIAIKMEFNNPLLSIFTMLKNTAHCEITTENSNLQNPVFFVSEPTNLKQIFLDVKNYNFMLLNKNC